MKKDKCTKTTLILLLIVSLLPALVLMSFCPRLGRAYKEDLARMEESYPNETRTVCDLYDPGPEFNAGRWIPDEVINDLLLHTVYLSADLRSKDGLPEHDRDYLYDTVFNESFYYLKSEDQIRRNIRDSVDVQQLLALPDTASDAEILLKEVRLLSGMDTVKAALYLRFDAYGKPELNRLYADPDVWYSPTTEEMLRCILDMLRYDNELDYQQLLPKNTEAVYLLTDTSEGLGYSWEESIYLDMDLMDASISYAQNGAIMLVLLLAGAVMLAGLILPGIRPLHTGWEKLFGLSFEVVFYFIGTLGFCGAIGMYFLTSVSNPLSLELFLPEHTASFLGFSLSADLLLRLLYILDFAGWALCFLVEYIFVVSLRQFFASPKAYLKERVLFVRLLARIRRRIHRIRDSVRSALETDLDQELNTALLKLVGLNLAVIVLLCLFFAAGTVGALLYTILLYLFLRKQAGKIQLQYRSLIAAAGRMSEGHLDTELKEEELGIFRSLGHEINRIRDGFSKAVDKEARSQKMKTELISNVSHDLRTPLTAIITYVDLLKDEELSPEKRREYVNTLENKTDRLKVLIDDLFEASKASSGDLRMNYADVDLVRLLKEIRLEYEDPIGSSGLDFRWNLPQEKVLLSLDPARTCRIIENLLQNILNYSMPHSRVYIDLTQVKGEVLIGFRNISAEEMNFNAEEITQRFVRGDLSRSTEGSGLGLAIARSFTELQGGVFDLQIDGDLFKVCLRFPVKPLRITEEL